MAKKIKHGWNTWDNYYSLEIKKSELKTQKGNIVFVKIEKDIEIQEGLRKRTARTDGYSYHCWRKYVSKTADESLIRYCSPHETHNKFHHKHEDLALPPLPCLILKPCQQT